MLKALKTVWSIFWVIYTTITTIISVAFIGMVVTHTKEDWDNYAKYLTD